MSTSVPLRQPSFSITLKPAPLGQHTSAIAHSNGPITEEPGTEPGPCSPIAAVLPPSILNVSELLLAPKLLRAWEESGERGERGERGEHGELALARSIRTVSDFFIPPWHGADHVGGRRQDCVNTSEALPPQIGALPQRLQARRARRARHARHAPHSPPTPQSCLLPPT
jgi:hypothetical protein